MPHESVMLTRDDQGIVDDLLATGRFRDAGEAVGAALRLLREEETRADALLARIMVGYGQAERGEFVDGDGEEVVRRAFEQAAAEWEAEHGVEAEAS